MKTDMIAQRAARLRPGSLSARMKIMLTVEPDDKKAKPDGAGADRAGGASHNLTLAAWRSARGALSKKVRAMVRAGEFA